SPFLERCGPLLCPGAPLAITGKGALGSASLGGTLPRRVRDLPPRALVGPLSRESTPSGPLCLPHGPPRRPLLLERGGERPRADADRAGLREGSEGKVPGSESRLLPGQCPAQVLPGTRTRRAHGAGASIPARWGRKSHSCRFRGGGLE